MYYLILLSALMGVSPVNTLKTEGFELSWEQADESVMFTLSAPTSGWVAVGFTENEDIVDSNLIMLKVEDDLVYGEDQYVVGFGKHPTVESLGVESRIFNLGGNEERGRTTVSFSIIKEKLDDYHFDLSEGNEINIWLAWSVSDDFDHHSRKRILRRIEL